jgi:putative nucleotidyltransferase-like protein
MPLRRANSRAERQLILLSAGTASRRAELSDHAERLADEVDWHLLTTTLAARRLLTILGPRLGELAPAHGGEEPSRSVESALATRRRQSVLLQLLGARVTSLLAQAGIRASPLKGPQLGERIYGDPSRRPSSDVDVLVPADRLREAVEVVRDLGYRAPTDEVDTDGLPGLHLAMVHEHGELPPVELHWRIHWYESSFAGERLLAPDGADPLAWHPAPGDELAALLLFYARDGFVDLRLAADLGAWWDVYGQRVDPGALSELSAAYPALARALAVSATVAHKLVGLPAMPGMPKPGLRDRGAIRLANPNPHTSRAQLYADIGMIDALLTPRGELGAFIRRQVLPSSAVLKERTRVTKQRRGGTRPGHAVRVITRYAFTAARLVRAPERPVLP